MRQSEAPLTWIKPYYPAFNGLRALAVLAVFGNHFGHLLINSGIWNPMFAGVDLFFVLSGFLITGILYDSVHSPRYFRNFYIRRALRIFPIFYAFFLVLFLVTPLLHLRWHANLLTFFFYVGNLYTPHVDVNVSNPTQVNYVWHGYLYPVINIGHLWSLCVEEQFYLLWPAVVLWLRDRRKLILFCIVVCVLTLVLRVSLAARHIGYNWRYMLLWSTFTRWDTLLFGAVLALWLRGAALSRRQLRLTGAAAMLVGLAGLLIPLHFDVLAIGSGNEFMLSWGLTAIAITCCGVLLLSLDEEFFLSRLLKWRLLAGLGTISYGFYFIHALFFQDVFKLAYDHRHTSKLLFFADLIGSVTLAWLSFRYFESPFLRLKNRWAPQDVKAHPHVPEPQPAA